VAEQTKASVGTGTRCPERDASTRTLQKPTGAQLEILLNLKTCFNQPFQIPPPNYKTTKTANGHSFEYTVDNYFFTKLFFTNQMIFNGKTGGILGK